MVLWFSMDQVDRSKPVTWKDVLFLVIFPFALTGIAYLMNYRREKLLENYNTTSGVVVSKHTGSYKQHAYIDVTYKINGKSYKSDAMGPTECCDCIYKVSIGDTVMIKYSKSDPNIISIIDCEEGK